MTKQPIRVCSTRASFRRRVLPVLGGAAAAFVLALAASAGPLNPPAGPVASTGKTLTDVEPRIAINATSTPGNATAVHRITQSGSYYLTGNIVGVAGRRGISIEASNVTIDLNGFTVQGVAGTLDGISTIGIANNLTVRNGTVDGWGQDGIDLRHGGIGQGSLVVDVLVSNNSLNGVRLNNNAVVRGCIAFDNGQDGFNAPANAVFVSCIARDNGGYGFIAGNAAVLEDCSSRANGIGFSVQVSSVLANCSAYSNTQLGFEITASKLVNSVAQSNGGDGINTVNNSSVIGCTSASNTGIGILVSGSSFVSENLCIQNSGAGIQVINTDNRLEGNTCLRNAIGIDVNAAGNIILGNTCSGNTTNNWDVVAGNICLVVQAVTSGAITGNSGGVSPGSTNPHANFSY